MTIEQKQEHLMESLKRLKDHCLSREYCDDCEFERYVIVFSVKK